jgi:hypothetical protein
MYVTSGHKRERGNASNVQLLKQGSLHTCTLVDSDDETQSRAVGSRDRGSARCRDISAMFMGGIQSIRQFNLETPRHRTTIYSNHGHVTRTGNDQAIASPGERMSRVPPDLHIARQTATAAVSGRCHCRFVYICCILQNNGVLTPPKKASRPPVPPPHRANLHTKSPRPLPPLRLCLLRMPSLSPTRPWPRSSSRTTAQDWTSRRAPSRAVSTAKA